MKDEIKEILKMVEECSRYVDKENANLKLNEISRKHLLDYITTLQQENEKLKSIIKQIKEEFNKKGNPCFTFYGFWLKVRDILGDKND